MSEYRVQQRLVPTRILTPSGWLSARLHVGLETPFLESINRMSDFIKLTHVLLPGTAEPLAFVALQRRAAHLVVPDSVEENLHLTQLSQETVPRRIVCLMAQGALTGSLHLQPDARMSDYLLNCDGFFALWDAAGAALAGREVPGAVVQAPSVVLVNARAVIGVAESEQ